MTPPTPELPCELPPRVPVLVLKSTVLFPLQVASIQIADRHNLRLLEEHDDTAAIIGVGFLKNPDGPYSRRNLGSVAVASRVLSRIPMEQGTTQVVFQGLRRVRLRKIVAQRPYFRAEAECIEEPAEDGAEVKGQVEEILRLVRDLVALEDRYTDELIKVAELNAGRASRCADVITDMLPFPYPEKRQLLGKANLASRLRLLAQMLRREIARTQVTSEVRFKTRLTIDRAQREAFLREQLRVIRRELQDLDPAERDIAQLIRTIEVTPLPPLVAEELRRAAQRLRDTAVREHEGVSLRAYLDWVLSIPWENRTRDRLDLRRARRMLDARYFGLGGARDRLLEFLAVRKLGGHTRSPLLAITGPPGTGRTSLAETVAEVLDRRFVRISMQGIHDEAEIRGHRRPSSAARPGRILDGLRQAGARNPVILVDHIDLLEPRAGDPMLAIVEAIDPERNREFRDHYLGTPFDLSEVLFVITANVDEDIPEALWPIAYSVELSGYTDEVKVAIAREQVWPSVVEEHGLVEYGVHLTPAALRRILRDYTREAGVRELKERLQQICRRLAVRVATRRPRRVRIDAPDVRKYLGKPVYAGDEIVRESKVGVALGLAWTESGGALLPVEALLMPGDGYITLTGLLGEVMQESVDAALSYVRSRGEELGIPEDLLSEKDLHVHFPEGAIPKDGPSAGIAVATTIASLLSGRAVKAGVAMTGEISLQGRVLPVGGLREKLMAAHRAGVKSVVVPKGNESDLADVPRVVRGRLGIHLVRDVSEVFRLALEPKRRRAARSARSR